VTLEQLGQLESRISACTKCGLHETARNKVFGSGNPSAVLMIVGEAPGREENAAGVPFIGDAGKLLDKALEKLGVDRASLYICNILKCWPPGNRRPEPNEMAACIGYLEEQIGIIKPKIIVALGATSAQALLQVHSSIGKIRGTVAAGPLETLVMPTWHPAYICRMGGMKSKSQQKATAKQFLEDLASACSIAGIKTILEADDA